jgi:asparagine synthase (glutamine-hydrolysing)
VLLDGFDGDATVSHGFGRLNALMATGDWSTFEAEVRAFAGHRGRSPESVLPHFGFPLLSDLARRGNVRAWLRGARELARRFTISRRDLAVNHGLRPAVMALGRVGQWSKPKSAASGLLRSDLARHIAPALREANDRAAGLDGAMERRMHLGSVAQPLYQLTLEIADKSARAFGVEPRYPFFDRRLIELCLGLPDEQKFADGWPRLVFRRAMEGVLPREVQWRAAKGNLAPNFDRRLRAADRSAIEAAMTDSPELARFMDVTALGEVARNYLGRTAWGGQDGPLLARATMLAGWLETAAANRRSVNGIEPMDPDSSREPSGSISSVRCLTA